MLMMKNAFKSYVASECFLQWYISLAIKFKYWDKNLIRTCISTCVDNMLRKLEALNN